MKKQAAWLDDAIDKGIAHHAMFHGIVPEGGGWQPFRDAEVFEQILQNLEKRKTDIWVCSVVDFCMYGKLRDSAVIERHDVNPISFTVETADHYDFPLTVKITPCPAELAVTQDGKPLDVVRRGNSGYVNVIPEHGEVMLSAQ